VSTLKYRLAQIAKILGRRLTDPRDRFELSLGYEVLDVLEVIGAVPFTESVRSRPS
jgi:DNA-binding PucR family transcriptional regulator